MQQIRRRQTVIQEEVIPVTFVSPVAKSITSSPVKKPVSSFEDLKPLSFKENKEARALGLLEYTALKQAYEQFSLRTADNLLLGENEHISSIVGLLGAEVNAIKEMLSTSNEEKSEHFIKKQSDYLRSLLKQL